MAGFTMFELMITVAIVAILAGIALPNYREFMIRMTVTENVNTLLGALNTARAEAVKRGRRVAVIANGGDWNSGWQIVAGKATAAGSIDPPVSAGLSEADCAGDLDLDNETPLCARFDGPLPESYRILAKSESGLDDTQVVFASTGTMVNAGHWFNFSVCRPITNPDPAHSRQITVAESGIVTTQRDTSAAPAGTCG
ncbi:MAG TPA: GspH/FimT family pseudopilin [Dokdonella sp.]|nr:GspH/FimT family pseudopilin [Dokdonella sp.]